MNRKQVEFTSSKAVVVPINLTGYHWLLAVADIQRKLIRIYDSMPFRKRSFEVSKELVIYFGSKVEGTWKFTEVDTLAQSNGSDCGAFTCYNIRKVSLGVEIDAYLKHWSSQKLRNHLGMELTQEKLLDLIE